MRTASAEIPPPQDTLTFRLLLLVDHHNAQLEALVVGQTRKAEAVLAGGRIYAHLNVVAIRLGAIHPEATPQGFFSLAGAHETRVEEAQVGQVVDNKVSTLGRYQASN